MDLQAWLLFSDMIIKEETLRFTTWILTARALQSRWCISLSDSLPYGGLPPYLCCTVHRHDSALGCVLSCGPWCKRSSASFHTRDMAPSPHDGLYGHAAGPWWQRLLHISVGTGGKEEWRPGGGNGILSAQAMGSARRPSAPTCNKKLPLLPPLFHFIMEMNSWVITIQNKDSGGSVAVSIQQFC